MVERVTLIFLKDLIPVETAAQCQMEDFYFTLFDVIRIALA